MKTLRIHVVLLLFGLQWGYTQELPLINQFFPENYNAESQNWSITQAANGYIYVANNIGLLEFNGARWNVYPTPNQTIMRSVKAFDDKVFTGFYMDFGFWKRDVYGSLQYTSLVKEQNISLLDDEQFWNIIELDGWVLFQSLQRIYIYNLETGLTKVINSQNTITKLFKVEDSVYFQEIGKGIFKIEKGIAKLETAYDVLQDNIVVLIYKENNELIFLTDSKGFYTKSKPFIFENNETSDFVLGKTIYSASKLKNGYFVIGTISNGMLYSKVNGAIIFELNQKNGLSNNTILSTLEDSDDNVWLGLDNGINEIDITSTTKIFKDVNGTLGTVYTASYYDGNLYLGTNQGLFYKKYPSNKEFKFIKGTQGQVWSLDVIQDELFCGHNTGTYIVKKGTVKKISSIQGTWGIKELTKNKLLQGNYDGLYVLKKVNGTWELLNKIKGFDISSKFFEVYYNHTIFVNHEYKGICKLTVDKEYTKVIAQEIDTIITKGIHSSLVKYQNNILYTYKGGVYKYLDKAHQFIKDTLLSKIIKKEEFITGRIIPEENTNRLFGFSKEHINYIKPDKFSSNSIIVNKGLAKGLREGAIGYENIKKIQDEKYLMGTLNGYIVTDLKNQKEKTYTISINTIENYSLNHKSKLLKLHTPVNLSSKENNLKFSYSIPYLSKDLNLKYQYKLDGYTTKWSEWTGKSDALFENLSFGDYTFQVRGKIGGIISNTATFTFSIERAWYISNWAIASYVLFVFLFSVFMDRHYKRSYRKQKEVLLEKQQNEFQLKTLANEKELIEIKNAQLKQDVESKNRELGISTMSIIKKNELLSTIKKEIGKGDEKNIKNVIKIIDKNLNNTDDWQMFKEAFNNADKDFIKKVKSMHDNLTPNDLRLCAYLRLNLSSKEIAPLLNISPRSVEVKRYRLRKKMNLPHDANLTNYILEI